MVWPSFFNERCTLFVLIVSEDNNILTQATTAQVAFTQKNKVFCTTLLPPDGALGMPLTDPFEVLLSFDFSNKLSFPKSTLILFLAAKKPVKQESSMSYKAESIRKIYQDALWSICGNDGENSSTYLRELKLRKADTKKNLIDSLEKLKVETGSCDTDLLECWKSYAGTHNYLFQSIDVESTDNAGIKAALAQVDIPISETSDESTFKVEKVAAEYAFNEFTMPYSSMGFGDFYQRLERLYDFVKTFADFKFIVEPYTNPHSTELDFNRLVNTSGDIEKSECVIEKTIDIADFYALILSSGFNASRVKFNIIMGPGRAILNNTELLFNTEQRFIKKLSLESPNIPYLPFKNASSVKVVYHMRRHDTALRPFEGILPSNLKKKLGVERPLLDYVICDQILASYLAYKGCEDSLLEIVVISDGVDDLLAKYEKVKGGAESIYDEKLVQQKFNQLRDELDFGESGLPNAVISSRVIGRDKEKTLESVKAISEADFVITSSGFSIFMARIVGADYVNGFQALPLLQKGITDFSKIISKNEK